MNSITVVSNLLKRDRSPFHYYHEHYGSPVAAVNPRVMKWPSVKVCCCSGCIHFPVTYFVPLWLPSLIWEALSPTSSTHINMSGRVSKSFVLRPNCSSSFSVMLPSLSNITSSSNYFAMPFSVNFPYTLLYMAKKLSCLHHSLYVMSNITAFPMLSCARWRQTKLRHHLFPTRLEPSLRKFFPNTYIFHSTNSFSITDFSMSEFENWMHSVTFSCCRMESLRRMTESMRFSTRSIGESGPMILGMILFHLNLDFSINVLTSPASNPYFSIASLQHAL
jgi:hypothetical protein